MGWETKGPCDSPANRDMVADTLRKLESGDCSIREKTDSLGEVCFFNVDLRDRVWKTLNVNFIELCIDEGCVDIILRQFMELKEANDYMYALLASLINISAGEN